MTDPFAKTEGLSPNAWQALLTDLARTLRFYSRLPVPPLAWERDPHALPDFGRLVRVLPLAGMVLGLLPALALLLGLHLGLGPWLSAMLALAASAISTGAFHEDGLADTADSFGGGTMERRLAIMKDSRIGTFGAGALILAFALRIGALATLAERTGALGAVAGLIIAASLSRVAGLVPLVFLPPARADGAAQAVGRPPRADFATACALAAGLAVLLGLAAGLPPAGIGLMILLSALAGWGLMRLARTHLGGQTGDIAGAAQQAAEIAAMLGLLIALQP